MVNIVSPAPRDIWKELCQQDPEALPSQSPEWLDCLCAFGSHQDASRYYEFDDGQRLVLPMVRRNWLLGVLSTQASLPHAWGAGGVLAKNPVESRHMDALYKDLLKSSAVSTSVLPNPQHTEIWNVARPERVEIIPRRAHLLDLSGGFETVWRKRFSKSTRRLVRQAEKLGVVVESDTTRRLAPIFYQLHRLSTNRWAQQQREPRWLAHLRANVRDPLSKIEHIADFMGEVSRIWVAWHEGVPVAASLVLRSTNADDIMSAMDKRCPASTAANSLLLKASIEDACQAGCRYYHLGESGQSVGLAHFKERFGANAYDYPEIVYERIPLKKLNQGVRSVVKRVIGFKDA